MTLIRSSIVFSALSSPQGAARGARRAPAQEAPRARPTRPQIGRAAPFSSRPSTFSSGAVCAALALFAGAAVGCAGDDEPSEVQYRISYVKGDETATGIKERTVYLDGREPIEERHLAFGSGTLKAAPRGSDGYGVEIVDADGTRALIITCEVRENEEGTKNFKAQLADGSVYNIWVKFSRASCSGAP